MQEHLSDPSLWPNTEKNDVRGVYSPSFGRRCFAVAGPSTWNSLPDSLRDPALSLNIFRRQLKTHFFREILTRCTERIRDFFENALYKLTLYLLTYSLDTMRINVAPNVELRPTPNPSASNMVKWGRPLFSTRMSTRLYRCVHLH